MYNNRVVVMDLEFARPITACSHTLKFNPGTPEFRAPEMQCSPKLDSYSCASVFLYWVSTFIANVSLLYIRCNAF